MRAAMAGTFRSLRVRNYRLFFLGQLVSLSGTWMQTVALGWLVLDLSDGSAFAVGVVTALQQVPTLVLGAWGGVLTDRFDKRRALVVTQSVAAVAAGLLALLTLSGHATVANIGAVVVLVGLSQVVDMPARQTFVNELVGPENLINAVGLNGATINATRIVGPAIAGVLLVTVGAGWCFALNAVSYVAVIIGLLAMRTDELHPVALVTRAKGQVREGLRYIAATPELRANLVLMLVTGTLAVNFPVILPVLAKVTFDGDAGTYSVLTSAMGVGALVGSLVAASRRTVQESILLTSAAAFGVAMCVSAMAPTLGLLVPLLVVTGLTNITMFATSATLLQLQAEPTMRGRVLAVRGVTVLGSTPVGAPIIGWICNRWGPRWGLAVGGLATLLAAAWLWTSVRGRALPAVDREDGPPEPPSDLSDPALV